MLIAVIFKNGGCECYINLIVDYPDIYIYIYIYIYIKH